MVAAGIRSAGLRRCRHRRGPTASHEHCGSGCSDPGAGPAGDHDAVSLAGRRRLLGGVESSRLGRHQLCPGPDAGGASDLRGGGHCRTPSERSSEILPGLACTTGHRHRVGGLAVLDPPGTGRDPWGRPTSGPCVPDHPDDGGSAGLDGPAACPGPWTDRAGAGRTRGLI